ncbi:GNAT family N-acetyltransferase [Streptosporangiaceae bacterium NEAU-GS5]|nr:GNAT family N-acetyltransferase [Streptosporangiaceae bacterium NEAU-GS5]
MLRPATAEDLAAIESIVAEAYRPWAELIGVRPKPMDDDYPARVAASQVTVLTSDDVVVGLVVLVPEKDALLVDNVAVRPAHHGQGHGRRLLDFAEERARSLGLPALRLYTNALMTGNIDRYKRRGYVIVGEIRKDGRHVIFMRKDLGQVTRSAPA